MKIVDKINKALEDDRCFWSFEYFPPKTQQGVMNLYDRIERMCKLGPLFIDVTWRWGGRSSDLTLELCSNSQTVYGVEANMHMTCTNTNFGLIKDALEKAKDQGVQNVLALRGDLPDNTAEFDPSVGEFKYATDLVKYIRSTYGDYFCIAVAGYPEGCMGPEDVDRDIQYLKEKQDAGADIVVTQLFYDVDNFMAWVAKCRLAGITMPILPGIMPIQNYGGFKRMTELCRIEVPQEIWNRLEPIKDDDQAIKDYGIEVAVDMINKMKAGGVRGFHFYTINLERSTRLVLEKLNFVPAVSEVRPLPWNPSLSEKRAGENVRPIFWRNHARSYIKRTELWDEFPNGRWGDARSPAYGELVHGVQVRLPADQALRKWGTPESVDDVTSIFVRYCQGKLDSLPWSDTQLQAESTAIQNQLAQINGAGFLTINSQPSCNGAPSSDKVHGWGPSNGFVYKKAYLEFFVSPANMQALLGRLATAPTVTYYAVNKAGELFTNCAEDSPNAVTWGVFPGKEILQPTIVERVSFLAWKDEAFDFWNAWSKVYAEESLAAALLRGICSDWYLMNIVENNFQSHPEAIFELFDGLGAQIKE
ncbi:methylenetetrahydrofolate reductase (NAD(P)H) met13 [Coemansia aciculifera]|uniref:Methylenetetrahydrofolate reductase (NAD(P)H) met13 n=1 Tax=Coemansia pectinata TaxID=1052879 RepID=A0A9W8GSJ7_9FUNG|nr:methylenetetrahydrofolate reductase (NAD(P)H) met13 [Coemansia pectinata]KAJ2876899.1 methylenetetrahydrofolate reductase (NAD(P)H) met13 [Coemansia aciculifera]KAJ2884653.1 methylenetetrahydrofolate reductase (NAD(P)H) met13 [Coemansia aciculifera]